MKKITLKKNWVEKLEEMEKEIKFKCLIALYEYLSNERPTIEMMQGFEVAQFIKYVMEDIRLSEERRERNRQRRAEKAAREATQKEESERIAAQKDKTSTKNEATAETQPIDNADIYVAHPELHIFDGFMRYIIAVGDSDCRSILPTGVQLDEILVKFRQWTITHGHSREITRLNAFKGLFKYAIKEIA